VAVIGTYVVTTLVASSLDERLLNHLREAGRVVSDGLVEQEQIHLSSARLVGYVDGLIEALRDDDQDRVAALAWPAATEMDFECLIILDDQGDQAFHILRQGEDAFDPLTEDVGASDLSIVQSILQTGDLSAVPRRAIGRHAADERYYHFTAIPIGLEGNLDGVVVVGTSLDSLLPQLKSDSLADVTIYLDEGQAVASTFVVSEAAPEEFEELSITRELYQRALHADDQTLGEDVEIRDRWYRVARGPIYVANDRLGVFSVALPADFIVRAGAASRNTYALLFAAAMACVFMIGYLVARRITQPIDRLVDTTQAVAKGDLEQRTGIESSDEIGTLAATFDTMTGRLAERTQALQELMITHREAASRLRAILSSIGDGVVLEDLDGNLIPLNAVAEGLLEEMATNFQFGPLQELSASEVDEEPDTEINPWLLEKRRFAVGNKMLSMHSAAVRTDDGERLGTVIVLRDVTAEVEAEQLKDAFVAHVSHELRTPLTAIKGYSALMLAKGSDDLDPQDRSFLETISRHTDNLVTMVDELLDFSEIEARGRLELRLRPVQFSEIVEWVADHWDARMDEKGLTFRTEISRNLPAVDADNRRLRWAVVNLVRNAWQYTPEGGEVTLRLSSQDGHVALQVVDTGIGLSLEEQQHLFDRFHRGMHESDDTVRGLGLGLYITKAIVDAHGGELRVDSDVGVGSTFSLILPVSDDTPQEG
jgi:two-component system sensor histidine kinase VicK